MSTVLAYSLPWPGHVFPVISTLIELERRGHDVVLFAHPKARKFLDGAGIRIEDSTLDYVEPTDRPPGGRWQEDIVHTQALASRLGEPGALELERFIAAEHPDFLLVDPLIWGAMVVAEASGLPWAAAAHTCVVIPTRTCRPMGPGLPPARGIRSRVRYRLLATYLATRKDMIYLPVTNRLRVAHGLAPLRHAREAYFRPPLTLAFTAEPFEYPRSDWHPSVRFVGPALWETPAPPPPWTEALDARPLILACTSSFPQADAMLIEATLNGLADQPVQVIATVPTGAPLCLSGNARIEGYVPHRHLLSRAACVVCHGGFGITQKALAAGVPVVAVPFGRDQFEVARRLEVCGAGVQLSAAALTPGRLRDAVREAMTRRPQAERIAAAFRGAGGPAAAAAAIQQLL